MLVGRIYDEELAKVQFSQTALCIVPLVQDANKSAFIIIHGIISCFVESSLNRFCLQETPVLPQFLLFKFKQPMLIAFYFVTK